MEPMQKNCHDCHAEPGQFHMYGCDTETCPCCGRQSISCHCIYTENGYDMNTLEELHPDIYEDGPTQDMYDAFDAKYDRIPWSGESVGVAECREYGLYSVFSPSTGWKSVDKDYPNAREDLNTLLMTCKWNKQQRKFIPCQ